MTPPQKPEWIEIAEQDTPTFPRTVSKGLPVIALVVTASILGVGNLFAHSAEDSPTNAIEITAPAAPISQATEPTTATVAIQSIETQNSDEVKNPSIGTLPIFGEEEDDDDVLEYEDDDEDDDDDDYEDDEDDDEEDDD
ncbi:MAG: hypothetical protein Q8K48_08340 [Candidatus Planktophila sp.]|nr:hypothetical protein [Candidatus Planktophila sp.]